MKKNGIISVFLAAVMLLLSFTAVTAAEENSGGVYASDLKIMTVLGFMKSMNTADENAAVTRGMFTAAVVDLMGYSTTGSAGTAPFKDVNASTAYYKEICIAVQYGIIHGDPELNFNPDALITYTDALVIVENAMGYYTQAEYYGGYPNGYLKTATSLGLDQGLKVSADGRLNVGMCARLLLNAGGTEIITPILSGTESRVEAAGTLFWERHRIAKDTGIVKANEQTSIDSSEGAGRNGITIGNITGYVYFSNESTEYLGYNVEFYYREDDNNTNTILYMQPRNNEVTVIDGADVESFEGQTLTYYDGNRTRKETITKSTSVIFNGVYTIDYFFEDGTSIFTPEYGDLKLIDNNKDGRVDVVSILAYKNLVVSAVDKGECIVYDKYNVENNLDYSSAESTWVITDSTGNIMSFEDLKQWDIISLAKSRDGDVLRAVVSRNSSTGTVKGLGETEGKKTITTEQGLFFIAKSYLAERELPIMGTTVTLYLDYYGNVAAIESNSTASNYGFMIRSYYEPSTDQCAIRMMTAEGLIQNISCASKVRIDGDSFSGEALQKRMGSTEPDGSDAINGFEVISFKLNSNGEIYYLDTLHKGENEDKDSLHRINNFNGTYLWFATSRLFGSGVQSVCMDANTLIFKTPSREYASDLQDYKSGSLSELVYGIQYNVYAYSTDADAVVPDVVHIPMTTESASSMPRNARTCLIKDIREDLNGDDEVRTSIQYYSGMNEYESYVADGIDASSYQIGDIIKVTFNGRNEISNINHVYSVETCSFTPSNMHGTGADFGNEYQPYARKLFVREGDVIGVAETVDSSTTFADCTFQRIADKDAAIYVVKPGRKQREINRIYAADLPTIMDYYNNGKVTPVYMMTTYGVAKFLVIYEQD